MSKFSDERNERLSQLAIDRKRKELAKTESKAEAAESLLAKFLGKAAKTEEVRKQLDTELSRARRGEMNDPSMERIMRGEAARTVLGDPTPAPGEVDPSITGYEEYPWED